VAEGGGLLNRCTVKSCTGGSNPPLSARKFRKPLNPLSFSKARQVIALVALGFALHCYGQTGNVPGPEWQKLESLERAGWQADKLAKIHEYVEEIGSTSVMIVQHGVVVAAWGDVAHRANVHSCRKSLLNALIGIEVARGKIKLDDSLQVLGIDDNAPSLTTGEKQATVRDLLEARSGVYHPTVYETPRMKDLKPPRGSHAHGTFWYYNNWDFNTLGYIYEQATGERIFDAFYRRIAQPIGMQDFKPGDGGYITNDETRFPAYRFELSTRDFARFALLYLHKGQWNKSQIIPADWVETSTRPYSDTTSGGYGYLWWTADSASGRPPETPFPSGSFWAEGNLGQYAVIVPSLDLIVVNQVDSMLTGRTVNKSQMAQLVRLVTDAAPRN
jgi:CubicO group peptidase (beta-lactamase class C family)